MNGITTYKKEELPPSFHYPAAFLELIQRIEPNDLYPWYFFSPEGDVGRMALSLGLAHRPRLVPFARLELGDGDTACFDGEDETGDPAVIMLIVDRSDRSYEFQDFQAWLERARADAKHWANT